MAAARKKLIYLLDWQENGCVECVFDGATVLNWKSMKPLVIKTLRGLLTTAAGLELQGRRSCASPELPERTEINHMVELAPRQAQRYEAGRPWCGTSGRFWRRDPLPPRR